ncbi:hypothetical protein TrVFT333_010334 [Trichoderma virens FT-333]|nr:hypothetical protein TrVFT333_010334 [Trichoderma virens FT-333]
MNEKYKDSMSAMIAASTRQFMNDGRFAISNNKTLHSTIETQLLSSTELLRGPISMLTPYLTLLFQRFTLNSLNSIENEIANLKATQLDVFSESIRALKSKPPSVQLWASTALSWILQVHRPLRLEELSAAIAIDMSNSNMENLRGNLSMAIEADLKAHLTGFITVEQQYVHLINSEASSYLLDDQAPEILHLLTEEELVKIALHYITMVFKSELRHSTDVCLSGRSDHHDHADPDPILGFMDYVSRFWHVHFLRIETPSEDLKEIVVKFLSKKQIANKWFDLYLRNNGLTSYLLGKETIMTTAARWSGEEKENFSLEYSPLQIACYFGLTSLLSILGYHDYSQRLQILHVRHGHSEHDAVVLRSEAVHFLDKASLSDDDQFMQILLNEDTDLISKYFPLHRAAVLGLSKAFKLLFPKRDDLPQVDIDGRTPLHMAAICGSIEIISFMIHQAETIAGHDILNILDKDGETALITAARLGNFQAVRLLVEAGTDINIRNNLGKTAVHYSVLNCPQALEILAKKNNQALRSTDASGSTALHLASKIGSIASIIVITDNVLDENLLDLLDAIDQDGRTALQHAAENGYDEIASHLITKGKSLGSQEISKMAYIYAAKSGHLSTLKVITTDELQIGPDLLVEASGAGQLLVVHYLLQEHVSAMQISDTSSPAICAAASNGHVEIVRTLLRYGADINAKDADRQTPLHHAAKNGMDDVVDTLLHPKNWTTNTKERANMRANINAVDSSRYTPLHLAAKSGHVRVVELLVRSGPDLAARSRKGETPLHFATKYPEIVKILLEYKAEVNAVDVSDQTPLHIAAETGCVEAAKQLMFANADTEAVDNSGKSPLYYAIKNQRFPMVEAIVKHQNKSSAARKNPWPNLELAVTQSDLKALECLAMQAGDIKELVDHRQRTLLHIAAGHDSHQIVSYLVQIGLFLTSIDEDGRTPLHSAAEKGLVDNMKVLFEAANTLVDMKDRYDDTPLHLAVKNGHLKAVSYLLDIGSSINTRGRDSRTPLFQAAYAGEVDIVAELLDHGADPEILGDYGWYPLHAAADNLKITQLFINKKTNINIQMQDLWTPLHLSVNWQEREVTQLLLENGADPNIFNDGEQTPFHLSFYRGMEDIFIQHQGPICVDLKKYDSSGHAPIHSSVSKSSRENLTALIDAGANLQAKARFMKSCLAIAVEDGRADNLSVLLDRGNFSGDNPTWDDDEIACIYWLAISKLEAACVRELTNHGVGLPQEIRGGLSELKAFVDSVQTGCEMSLFVKRMMNFGFSPFKRSSPNKISPFEFQIIYHRNDTEDFLLACIRNVDEALLPKPGFKELRAASELDFSTVGEALQPNRENIAKEETDQDSWTIDHFIYQCYPRIKLDRWDEDVIKQPTKLPDAIILPTSWQLPDADYTTRMAIGCDGLEVVFQYGKNPISLRSNFPFPPRKQGQVYFEIAIQDQQSHDLLEVTSNKDNGIYSYTVGIGFCGEFCNLQQRHIGWETWSVGYHGDNGGIYHEVYIADDRIEYKYGPGNTVGCGINYDSGEYFFTLDGVFVYSQSSDIIYRKLYPVVSHRYLSCQIKVNFGKNDFKWADANPSK